MAEVTGVEKIGEAAAALMDAVEMHLGGGGEDHEGGEVVEVIIAAELSKRDGETEYCQMIVKSPTGSPIYRAGLIAAAAELLAD